MKPVLHLQCLKTPSVYSRIIKFDSKLTGRLGEQVTSIPGTVPSAYDIQWDARLLPDVLTEWISAPGNASANSSRQDTLSAVIYTQEGGC